MSNPPHTLSLESLIEYEPFVRKVLRNMVVDEDQLGDLVQETWVRVLRRPPEDRQGIRGWLATVARNLARDAKRGASHRIEREQRVARPEADTSAQASNERMELHQKVVQAVLALEEPYKSVVVLSYYDGLSHKEIAQKLGRKESTVRSQLHRAHGLLKTRLDGEFGDRREWMAIGIPWILSKEGSECLTPAGGGGFEHRDLGWSFGCGHGGHCALGSVGGHDYWARGHAGVRIARAGGCRWFGGFGRACGSLGTQGVARRSTPVGWGGLR